MKLDVLDKGYVRLLDSMGSDLDVVNAARVSYDKRSELFGENDHKLLKFLVRENHTAPFRHAIVKFEAYAPLMVKNQWFKHLIGGIYTEDAEFAGLDPMFAWNESSRRYVTEDEEFYVPDANSWRSKPANSKQGSGSNFSEVAGSYWTKMMNETVHQGAWRYQSAMDAGIAPEQARLFLPAYAMYVRWQWTTSLQGVMHFLKLRDEEHAQKEIRDYAVAVKQLTATKFPVSIGSLDGSQ